jgi:hypothetical protein
MVRIWHGRRQRAQVPLETQVPPESGARLPLRWAVIVLIGVTVGVLTGLSAGLATGLAVGIGCAAAVHTMLD